MSAPFLFRVSKAVVGASAWVCLVACAQQAQPASVWSEAEILKRYSNATAEDRSLAQSLAEQARKRVASQPVALKNNLGPLVKLWCEAVMVAPDPENLVECARHRFDAVGQMSNPQPSKEAARLQHAQDSLAMIHAAVKIAGDNSKMDTHLSNRLKKDEHDYRQILEKKKGSE